MPSYVCQIDVDEQRYQNSQEFVSLWGEIKSDVERIGGEITDTYAVLGDYDFHVMFTVDDEDTAFQVTQSIERHGLDTKTMQAIPLERLGELVRDY